ncbi:flippase [Haloarchaeobius litoreus]|uniref:Flippase n=1 Tax=Haloarchaeobius litoreus TaxID=755306 RepID=A0ABD6DKV7_9EURY|nr:flippase [Haloarchaeobius litoreus]
MSDNETALETLLSGGSIVFLGLILQNLTTFVAKVVIARILGQRGIGEIALGVTILAFATSFVLLGMNTAVGRYLPRQDDQSFKRGVAVSALQIVLPISLVVGIALFVLAEPLATRVFDSPESATTLAIFGVVLPFAAMMRYAIGAMQGLKRSTAKVLIQNILFPVSRFAFVIVALVLGAEVVGVAGAYGLAYVLGGAVGMGYILRQSSLLTGEAEPTSMHRELVAFSLPAMVTASMLLIHRNIDILVVGYYASIDVVGVYDVVYTLATLMGLGLSAFGFIFLPVFSEAESDGRQNDMREVFAVAQKWVLIISLPPFLAFLLAPEVVVSLTFGPEYVTGSLTLSVLGIAYLTQGLVGLNGHALTAVGETRLLMYDALATAVANLYLNVLLVPRYGALGAAIATVGSFVVLNLLCSYQLHKRTDIVPVTKQTLMVATMSSIVTATIYLTLGATAGASTRNMVLTLPVFAVSYLVTIVRYGGITEVELAYLDDIEARLGRDLSNIRYWVRLLRR